MTHEVFLSDVHLHKKVADLDDDETLHLTIFELADDDDEQDATRCLKQDDDGDYEIARRPRPAIAIYHRMATRLAHVGTQVWRGALLMCDYALAHRSQFAARRVLELGAGTGLASIALARCGASRVACTDGERRAVALCARNVRANDCDDDVVRVSRLDWRELDAAAWRGYDVVVACDCVYDDVATDALVDAVRRLTSWTACYFALEKRVNFSADALRAVSDEYDHFRRRLDAFVAERDDVTAERVDVGAVTQALRYERCEQLELWKVVAGR